MTEIPHELRVNLLNDIHLRRSGSQAKLPLAVWPRPGFAREHSGARLRIIVRTPAGLGDIRRISQALKRRSKVGQSPGEESEA